MNQNIESVVINGINYLPEKRYVTITTETVKHNLPLVDLDKYEKLKERNRRYYQKNKDKWIKYNETKRQNDQLMKDLRTVLEFY